MATDLISSIKKQVASTTLDEKLAIIQRSVDQINALKIKKPKKLTKAQIAAEVRDAIARDQAAQKDMNALMGEAMSACMTKKQMDHLAIAFADFVCERDDGHDEAEAKHKFFKQVVKAMMMSC